jgi:hypothetical protein
MYPGNFERERESNVGRGGFLLQVGERSRFSVKLLPGGQVLGERVRLPHGEGHRGSGPGVGGGEGGGGTVRLRVIKE